MLIISSTIARENFMNELLFAISINEALFCFCSLSIHDFSSLKLMLYRRQRKLLSLIPSFTTLALTLQNYNFNNFKFRNVFEDTKNQFLTHHTKQAQYPCYITKLTLKSTVNPLESPNYRNKRNEKKIVDRSKKKKWNSCNLLNPNVGLLLAFKGSSVVDFPLKLWRPRAFPAYNNHQKEKII